MPLNISTLGYAPCATKKTLYTFFFARFHRKIPIFSPTFTQWPPETPCHRKTLTHLCHSNPSFSQLIVKQVTIFDKIRFFKNFNKVDEMVRNSWPSPWKPHFTERPPIFVRFVTERPPFLTQFVTELEDPYIWGTWWHWYVTFICECPPGFSFTSFLCVYMCIISESWLHQVESLEFADAGLSISKQWWVS